MSRRSLAGVALGLLAALLVFGCSSASKRIEELSASPVATTARPTDLVRVLDQGFVWDGETLSYAFTLENTSEDTSLEGTHVQVSVYDAKGEALGSDTGLLDFVLPKQVVAFAAHLPMAKEPSRIDLSFAAERRASVSSVQTFERVAGNFEATSYGGRVVAAVKNPYERELRRLKVVAILRTEDGKILNGGSAVLESLLARGEAIVTVDILGVPAEQPASVDVYTTFTAETVYRLQ